MTLFWHGHLATSNAKVQNAQLMQQHVALLRKHALGRFDAMLEAVSRDPAMLVWLDADANRKAQPSEQLARALFERFTLGPGNFTEEDVARGRPGPDRLVRPAGPAPLLRSRARRRHQAGAGREGNFDVDDVVRIALGQSATPRFLVRKLYRWLISETDEPDEKLIAPLAESLARDYDVSRVVETMLRSNLFFSEAAYRRRVKGPVEFAVGIVRGLEGLVPTERLGADLAALGQNLYHPPTTLGWQGGRHWINEATLIGRAQARPGPAGAGRPLRRQARPGGRRGQARPRDAGVGRPVPARPVPRRRRARGRSHQGAPDGGRGWRRADAHSPAGPRGSYAARVPIGLNLLREGYHVPDSPRFPQVLAGRADAAGAGADGAVVPGPHGPGRRGAARRRRHRAGRRAAQRRQRRPEHRGALRRRRLRAEPPHAAPDRRARCTRSTPSSASTRR